MKITTPKKLRNELKNYLDHAQKEPIKIKRRSGKTYILVSEERYLSLIENHPVKPGSDVKVKSKKESKKIQTENKKDKNKTAKKSKVKSKKKKKLD